MSKTKWYQEAVHLLVALAVVLAMVFAPLVPQGSPLSNVGPGVAQAQGTNVVNITWPTAASPVCVLPGGSLTVNWTYNTNCTSVCFSIRVYNNTTVIFENDSVNRTGLTPAVDNPFNETITINATAPANCNYYNLTITAGCPVMTPPTLQPYDTEVNAIFVDNVTPTVDLTAPSGDICIHEDNVTVTANVSDSCCLANVTFWYDLNGEGWNLIGSNNTGPGIVSVVWDTSSLVCAKNITVNATVTDCCNNTASDTVGNITIDHTLPEVTITSPTVDQCVSGNITVSANVTDNCTCVANVTFEYSLNGGANWTLIDTNTTQCANDTTCNSSVPWDTTALADACNVTIRANATDCCGNSNSTTVGNITINNELPIVSWNDPTANYCVNGNRTLNVTAGGAPNITLVEFFYMLEGGSWISIGTNATVCPCNTTCIYIQAWNTTALSDACNVTLRAMATDRCGITNNATVTNITINNALPTVSWNYPAINDCVNGTITLNATAGGSPNVTRVDFFYLLEGGDWIFIGNNVTACPCNGTCIYTRAWDTTALGADYCNVTLRAVPVDRCNIAGGANVGNISVNNELPYVILNNPAAGPCYSGNVTVNATAGGSPNVTSVDFYWLNGTTWELIGTNTTDCACGSNCTYTVNWNTTANISCACNVTINATATDWCGRTNSSVHNISIDNSGQGPVVSITSPLDNQCVEGNITVSANVTDNCTCVKNVTFEYSLDGGVNWTLINTNTTGCDCNLTPPCSLSSVPWNTTALGADYCNVTIRANATDCCGYSSLTTVGNISVNNELPYVQLNEPTGCVYGNVTLNATAGGSPNVTHVDFYWLNGTNWTLIGTNTTDCGCGGNCTYTLDWDTTPVPDSCNVTINATATDWCGKTNSSYYNVTVHNILNAPVRSSPRYWETIKQNNVTFNWTVPGVVVNPTYTLTKFEKDNPDASQEVVLQYEGCYENHTVVHNQTMFDDYYGWYVNVTDTCGEHTLTNTTFNTTNPKWYFLVDGGLEPPDVTVNAPNGGERWVAGSNQTITWSATDDITPPGELIIDIYYKYDGGSWNQIASSETNDGEYLWTVNNTISDMCLVKVTATDANGIVGLDASDNVFSIVDALQTTITVEVSAPSQPVLEGTNFTVTALIKNIGGTAASNVTVTMNATGDVIPASEVKPVIASIAAGDSVNKEFTLQCTGETDANVVVTAVGTNTNIDQDSAAVTQIGIDEPYLVVEVSAPSQPVLEGTNFTVTAVITNIGGTADSNVIATMNATGDAIPASEVKPAIASIGAGNSTSVEFTLRCTGETDVNVVVTAVGTNTAQDSAAVTQIPITEPYLVVEVSAPSQPVLEGTNFTVTALIKNIGGRAASNVTATMNATGAVIPASEVKPVITSIAAGDSVNREFALQCTGETDANVVVTAVGTNTNIAQDSAAVTQIPITVDITPPTVTVNRPNGGGEPWEGGSTETITWSATDDITPQGDLVIHLYYSNNSGTNWIEITPFDGVNDGAYLWTVPSINSSQCLVKVVAMDAVGNNGFDVSDGPFTITTPGAAITTIELYKDWNLISPMLYIPPGNRTPATLLASVLGNVDIVWGDYDPANSTWKSYIPSGPSSLTEIRDGKGYWINMTAADTLNLSALGSELPAPPEVPPSYNVVEGWNLIGFKFTTSKLASNYLAGIDGKYTVIYGYNAATDIYFTVVSGDSLQPGYGYWIAITEAGTIYP